jgi:hypothetical protein
MRASYTVFGDKAFRVRKSSGIRAVYVLSPLQLSCHRPVPGLCRRAGFRGLEDIEQKSVVSSRIANPSNNDARAHSEKATP